MRRFSFSVSVVALLISATASQLHAWTPTSPDAISVAQLSGAGYESAEAIAVDSEGNMVTVGAFEGTVDMDPGVGVTNVTPIGLGDIFLTKLNGAGELVWAKSIGGTNYQSPKSISIDVNDNIYLTGEFLDTVDFDPSSAVNTRTAVGQTKDSFVAKYTSAGDFVWVTTISSDGSDAIRSVTTDGNGNVFLAGSYSGNSVSSPLLVGGTSTGLGQSDGDDSIFIKLNSTGTLAWAKKIGNNISDAAQSIHLDAASNIYVLGSFQLTANMDPNGGTSNLVSAGQFDIYLAKYDSSGVLIWARAFGGAAADEARTLKVDNSGNAYFAGYFQGTSDFDPSSNRSDLVSSGSDDLFIAKITPTGDLAWAQRFGSTSSDQANSLTIDSQGNVLATGYFAGTADFDPGPGTDTLAVNSYGVFVVKVAANGDYRWARAFGGSNFDEGKGIAALPQGGAVVAGYFDGTSDFDPTAGTATLTSAGVDAFVLRLDSEGSASIDIVAPSVTWSAPVTPSSSRTVTFSATFSEAVSGISSSDFTNTGTATGCVFTPSAAATTSNLTLSVTCSSDGTVIPQLAANAVRDSSFNTGPTVASAAPSVTIATSSGSSGSPSTTTTTTVSTAPLSKSDSKTLLPSTGSSPATPTLLALFLVVMGVLMVRHRSFSVK